jgi:hypothetical protein
MSKESVFPTQRLDLPSQGIIYAETSPWSAGTVELHIPTAHHEDILTNHAFIQSGIVIDKLLESVVATKANLDELIEGDKNAIVVATRVLMFGADYAFKYEGEEVTKNLSELENKIIDPELFKKGVNEFDFALPLCKKTITFKLLTHADEKKIDAEIKSMKKINKNFSGMITTRLKYCIIAVDGNRDTKAIREFCDVIPAQDSRSLRKYIEQIAPDIDMKFEFTRKNGEVQEALIPITVDFFWPQ